MKLKTERLQRKGIKPKAVFFLKINKTAKFLAKVTEEKEKNTSYQY